VPDAAYFIPPLTTIKPDFHAVAKETLELLLAQVSDGDVGAPQRNVPPALVKRDSVAPPAQ
jgi:DNA-binding LacI/PurR family transcriptional regulator